MRKALQKVGIVVATGVGVAFAGAASANIFDVSGTLERLDGPDAD